MVTQNSVDTSPTLDSVQVGAGNGLLSNVTLNADGQLVIGSSAGVPAANTLTAGTGITITNSHNNISIAAAGEVALTFDGDTGTASPSGGIINIITNNAATAAGKTVLFSATGSTVTLKVQDSSSNIFIGNLSGSALTVGSTNTALGSTALASLTSATATVAVGWQAGNSLTTGTDNTFVGASSGSHANCTQNVAIGVGTLNHSTGIGNVAVGYESGGFTSGTYNVAIGFETIFQPNLTGNYNIGIGYQAGNSYQTSEDSNIVIGNTGVTGESHVIRIGTQGSGSNQHNACYIAGISGVTSVSSAVVAGLATGTGQLVQTTITAGTGISVTPAGGTITIATTGTTVLTVTSVNHAASPYTVLSTDDFIAVTGSVGTTTIKLPNAPTTGRVIIVKDSNGSAASFNIAVTTVGGVVTIDGATTYTMNVNYQSAQFIFDGSNYQVY